jgi:HEAT repeat protein
VRRVVDAEGREIRSVEELFEPGPPQRVKEGYARLFAELRTLRSEAAADGAGLAVLVLPFRTQLAPGAPPPRPQQEIAGFCREQGIPFLDALPALRGAARPPFIDIDHLSADGTRVVAEYVLGSGVLDGLLGAGGPPRLGTSVAELTRALDDPAPEVRAAAAAALEKAGDAARPAGAGLVTLLRDPDDNVRLRAADALVAVGPSPGWLPELGRMLEQDPPPVRAAAARVVAAMGPAGKDAVASLVAALQLPAVEVRMAACQALGRIGPEARAGVPALIGVMNDPGDARVRAAEALGLIRDASAAPALCGALADAQADLRWQAARALGRIGEGARACADALLTALGDPSADVRMAAVRALPRIGVERARLEPALEALRDDPSGEVRAETGRVLRSLRRKDGHEPD